MQSNLMSLIANGAQELLTTLQFLAHMLGITNLDGVFDLVSRFLANPKGANIQACWEWFASLGLQTYVQACWEWFASLQLSNNLHRLLGFLHVLAGWLQLR